VPTQILGIRIWCFSYLSLRNWYLAADLTVPLDGRDVADWPNPNPLPSSSGRSVSAANAEVPGTHASRSPPTRRCRKAQRPQFRFAAPQSKCHEMSCQCGLRSSIRLIFHWRGHFLSVFSRAMASVTSILIEPDKAHDAVARGEFRTCARSVLMEPAGQIGCHADIKRAVLLRRKNVDISPPAHRGSVDALSAATSLTVAPFG